MSRPRSYSGHSPSFSSGYADSSGGDSSFKFDISKIKDKKTREYVTKLRQVVDSQQSTIGNLTKSNQKLQSDMDSLRADNVKLESQKTQLQSQLEVALATTAQLLGNGAAGPASSTGDRSEVERISAEMSRPMTLDFSQRKVDVMDDLEPGETLVDASVRRELEAAKPSAIKSIFGDSSEKTETADAPTDEAESGADTTHGSGSDKEESNNLLMDGPDPLTSSASEPRTRKKIPSIFRDESSPSMKRTSTTSQLFTRRGSMNSSTLTRANSSRGIGEDSSRVRVKRSVSSFGIGTSGSMSERRSKKHSLRDSSLSGAGSTKPLSQIAGGTGYRFDNAFSSGDEIDLYETVIQDDRELLPIKVGYLQKKSEKMKSFNKRWVVLYHSFLLYYKNCVTAQKSGKGVGKTRLVSTEAGGSIDESMETKKSSSKVAKMKEFASSMTEVNHPLGSIFLRNYHMFVRNDTKYEITLVPHRSSVAMGFAPENLKIRFRCKSKELLEDWVTALRTAIDASRFGLITLQIRDDVIFSDVGGRNLSKASQKRREKRRKKKGSAGKSDLTGMSSDLLMVDDDSVFTPGYDSDETQKYSQSSRRSRGGSGSAGSMTDSRLDDSSEDGEGYYSDESDGGTKIRTRVFTESELMKLIQDKKKIQEELTVIQQRNMSLESSESALKAQLESQDRILELNKEEARKNEDNFKADLKTKQEKIDSLTEESTKLLDRMAELEDLLKEKIREQTKSEEKYEESRRFVRKMEEFNRKIHDRCKLERLQQLYPDFTNEQLFTEREKACGRLLDECAVMRSTIHSIPLINELVQGWSDLLKEYLKLITEHAILSKEHDSAKNEIEDLKQFIDEEYETSSSDPAEGLVLASQSVAPI